MPRYHRVYIDGTLAGGAERWSVGLGFTSSASVTPTPAGLTAWADAIMTSLAGGSGWAGNLKSLLSTQGSITGVRVYSYADVGAPADVQGASTLVALPGSGTPTMPPQCSLVASLLTGNPGKSFRGRIYWPHCGGALAAGGKSGLAGQTLTTNMGAWLGSLGALNTGDVGEVAVVSQALGAVTPVTTVSVGDVVDTQRRRRDALVEVRTLASV